jgi:hypothetical protein
MLDKIWNGLHVAAAGLIVTSETGGATMSSDEHAARQILSVFAKYKVATEGVLRRHQFFEVRDGDFQRGIDAAVSKGWIQRHARDRYRYILLSSGREAFSSVLAPKLQAPPALIVEGALATL